MDDYGQETASEQQRWVSLSLSFSFCACFMSGAWCSHLINVRVIMIIVLFHFTLNWGVIINARIMRNHICKKQKECIYPRVASFQKETSIWVDFSFFLEIGWLCFNHTWKSWTVSKGLGLELCVWGKQSFGDARSQIVEYSKYIVWSAYILSFGSNYSILILYSITFSLKLLYLWIVYVSTFFTVNILIDMLLHSICLFWFLCYFLNNLKHIYSCENFMQSEFTLYLIIVYVFSSTILLDILWILIYTFQKENVMWLFILSLLTLIAYPNHAHPLSPLFFQSSKSYFWQPNFKLRVLLSLLWEPNLYPFFLLILSRVL